jgi:WD40 repeat protein
MPVVGVAFSPDSHFLATLNANTLNVWQVATGNLFWSWTQTQVQYAPPQMLALASGGKSAALTTGQGAILLIRDKATPDHPANQDQPTLSIDAGPQVIDLQFTKDGRRLLAATAQFTTQEWNVANGRLMHTHGKRFVNPLPLPVPAASAVAWSNKLLAVLGPYPEVWTYDVAADQILHKMRAESVGVEALSFSADGRLLAGAGPHQGAVTSSIFLWDATTGKQLHRLGPGLPRAQTLCLAPDGRTLYTGHQDGQIRVWDTKTSRQKPDAAIGHNARVTALAYSTDSRYLISGSTDQTVRKWEVKTGKLLLTIKTATKIDTVAYAPDGKVFAAAGADKVIHLWQAETGKAIDPFKGHDKAVTEIVFSPDGKYLASRGRDQMLRLWDRASGKQVYAVKDDNEGPNPLVVVNGVPQPAVARGLVFLEDGKRLATGVFAGGAGAVQVRDTATGEKKRLYAGSTVPEAIAFAPDGRTLAIADGRVSAVLYETSTGLQRTVLGGESPFRPMPFYGFSGPGNFASGNIGSGFGFGSGVGGFGSGLGGFGGPCFSGHPIGNGFTIGGGFNPGGGIQFGSGFGTFNPGRFQPYAAAWGMVPGDPNGHTAPVMALAFAPRGKYIVTGGIDARVVLWNTVTNKVHISVGEHHGPVTCVAFAPDGKTLATAGDDTAIVLWDVRSLLAAAGKTRVDPVRQWWNELGSNNAVIGFQAMQKLEDHPERSLPFLKQELQPVKLTVPPIPKLLEDLGHRRYAIREKAAQELEKVAETIEPVLREALAKKPESLEVFLRLRGLLDKVPHDPPSAQRLRQMRAVEMLERMDVPASRQILEALARGAPEAWLTREAQKALERMRE